MIVVRVRALLGLREEQGDEAGDPYPPQIIVLILILIKNYGCGIDSHTDQELWVRYVVPVVKF